MTLQDNAELSARDQLAILVSTDKYLDHVVNLTAAAFAKGKTVSLFFTGQGVKLTLQPKFHELLGKAALSICDASFRANGLHGREHRVPGVKPKDFTTQAKNAIMLTESDRFLVF